MKLFFRLKRQYVFTLCLLTITGSLWSAGTAAGYAFGTTHGTIVGRINDAATGDVLPSVNISVLNTTLGASTNFKGEFFIIGVPVGRYELIASFIGYTTVKVTDVWVSAGLETSVNIILEPTTLELQKEIVVSATRADVGRYASGTNHIFTEDEITNIFAESPADFLATLPGISGDRIIRGGRPSDIDYQIDGISIRDALFADFSHESLLNNLSLREIQIKTGGFNAEYGNVMSGIVNLITREGGARWNGSIRVKNSLSSLNGTSNGNRLNPRGERIIEFTTGGPLPFLNKDLTIFLSGKINSQDNRTPGLNVTDPAGNNITDYSHNRLAQYSLFGKTAYSLSPNMKIIAAGLFGRRNQEEDSWLWRYNSNVGALPSIIHQNSFGYLRFTHTLSRRLYYEATVEYLESQSERGLKDESSNEFWSLDYDVSPYFGPAALLEFGADNPYGVQNIFISTGQLDSYWVTKSRYYGAKFNVVAQFEDYLHMRMGLESKFYHAETKFRGNSFENPDAFMEMYDYNPYDISGYGGSTLDFSRLHIDTGLRFHFFDPQWSRSSSNAGILVNSATPSIRFSPRVGLSFEIQKGLTAFTNFGWHHQLPSFHSLYTLQDQNIFTPSTIRLAGNPNLSPQRTISYEAGLNYAFSDVSTFSATGFYKVLQKLEVADTSSAAIGEIPGYEDSGKANSFGLEFNFVRNLNRNFGMRLSYTISSARGSYTFLAPLNEVGEITGTLNDLSGILAPLPLLQPTADRITFALPFDRRHSIRAIFDYTLADGRGPEVFGARPLQNLTANMTAFIDSGKPYTQLDRNGSLISGINAKRNPWRIISNLRLQKFFPNNMFGFSVFLDVRNLFNRVEPLSKYPYSDSANLPGKELSSLEIWEPDDSSSDQPPQDYQYSLVADLNSDGKIDGNEANAAYNRFLQDFIKLKTLYQLPREVWMGLQLHF